MPFVPRVLNFCPFDSKINEFPGLMVEHFYVKSGNPSCTGFEISCVKKPIDRQASKRCRCGLRRRGNGEWAEVDEEVGGRLYSRVSTVVVCTTFMFVVYAAATNSTRCTNDTLAE